MYDVRSSWVIRDHIKSLGHNTIRERVGHSFIKETMSRKFIINKQIITEKSQCFFVAELGANHCGSMKLAKDLMVRSNPFNATNN